MQLEASNRLFFLERNCFRRRNEPDYLLDNLLIQIREEKFTLAAEYDFIFVYLHIFKCVLS